MNRAMEETVLTEDKMLPLLHGTLHNTFAGPHTQYASSCFFVHESGSSVPAKLVVSCSQVFLC